MKKLDYIIKSFINAGGVCIYVSGVALLMFNGEKIFGGEDTYFVPIFMILLFVVSASITGLLVLGKPIHLYLTGFKKEAFILLFATLAWLLVFLAVVVFFVLTVV